MISRIGLLRSFRHWKQEKDNMKALENKPVVLDPKATQPWHPEILGDIDRVQLAELPPSNITDDRWTPRGMEYSGPPSFVREQMKEVFLRHPGVGFSLSHAGAVVVFNRLTEVR